MKQEWKPKWYLIDTREVQMSVCGIIRIKGNTAELVNANGEVLLRKMRDTKEHITTDATKV